MITKDQELDAENHRKIAENLEVMIQSPKLLQRVSSWSTRADMIARIKKMNEERKHG
jgi:hypothetical protein